MFEDQLILGAGFEQEGEFVEALDAAQELGAIDQIDSHRGFLATREIQKPILNVLWCRL